MMMSQNFNRRFSPNRRRTNVAALLHVDDRILPATVIDVSYDGMKLQVDEPVTPGTPLSVELATALIPAIVHWHVSPHIGLHLLERLDSETLIRLENADDEFADFR